MLPARTRASIAAMRSTLPLTYTVDPNDPRAPAQDVWDRLGEAERQRIVDALPESTADMLPGESTQHFSDKAQVFDTLRRHFDRIRRRIFVASELLTYYPGQPTFAPDILAVADVDLHHRTTWVVSHEGRGLDVALEILGVRDPHKDLRRNVEWFPSLGISEYFVYERSASRIHAFRLPYPGATTYERIPPHSSGYPSAVLGLDLAIEGSRLRFRYGLSPVPDADELIQRLDTTLDDLLVRRDADQHFQMEAVARAAAEQTLRQLEAELRKEAEAKLAAALAELERLRRS